MTTSEHQRDRLDAALELDELDWSGLTPMPERRQFERIGRPRPRWHRWLDWALILATSALIGLLALSWLTPSA